MEGRKLWGKKPNRNSKPYKWGSCNVCVTLGPLKCLWFPLKIWPSFTNNCKAFPWNQCGLLEQSASLKEWAKLPWQFWPSCSPLIASVLPPFWQSRWGFVAQMSLAKCEANAVPNSFLHLDMAHHCQQAEFDHRCVRGPSLQLKCEWTHMSTPHSRVFRIVGGHSLCWVSWPHLSGFIHVLCLATENICQCSPSFSPCFNVHPEICISKHAVL